MSNVERLCWKGERKPSYMFRPLCSPRDEGAWIDSSLAEPLLVSPCPQVMVPGRSPCLLPGRPPTTACQAWTQPLGPSMSYGGGRWHLTPT